jgi:hypothetical protein
MQRFFTAIFGAALLFSSAVRAMRADDRTYHDSKYNDDHHWDSHEDQAYRMWLKQNHRKYVEFAKQKEADQQAYWAWRHEHSDAVLKINIH